MPDDAPGLHRQVLRQHRRSGRRHAGATSPSSSSAADAEPAAPSLLRRDGSRPRRGRPPGRRRLPLADGLRRLQALHARGLPRGLPDRRAVPHRVRHRRRPGGRLQRLRLLRAGLPVRGASTSARSDGRRLEVHALLRPAEGRQEPACAQACPTDSIQFGELDELRERAEARLEQLQAAGRTSAQLYVADPDDGVGGGGAFFLLLDEPEVYGLPPDPVDTTRDLGAIWAARPAAAAALGAGARGRGARGDGGDEPRSGRAPHGGPSDPAPTTASRSSRSRCGRRRSPLLLHRRPGRRLGRARRWPPGCAATRAGPARLGGRARRRWRSARCC